MSGINESKPSYEVKNYFSYHTNEGHNDEYPDCEETSGKALSVSKKVKHR